MARIPAYTDDFFEGEPGLLGVFDYEYEDIIGFYKRLRWTQFILCPPAWVSCLFCTPCFLNQNIEWDTRSRHVALTVDGIKFVHARRQTLCGLSCTDRGKESKTVPYDKITDCDVQEPAGTACCCCIQNILHKVTVDTASSGVNKEGVPKHELEIIGLKHPHEFKQAVWSVKRGELPKGALLSELPTHRAPAQDKMSTADLTTPLLTDIREELRKMNSLMAAKYGTAVEERQREEEKQEERRRRKEEEKRRKREEKEKSKDSDEADAGRTDKVASGPGGLFKAVMKENETKRQHWGESVKGRVSSDYKGLTDAELERRFASPGGNASEKLMTEQEVLAMLRKGKDGKEKKKYQGAASGKEKGYGAGHGDFQIQIEKAGVSLLAALLLALVLVFLWLRHHCGRPPAHAASIPQSVGRVEAPSTFVSQPSTSSFVDLEAQLVEGRELVLSQEEKNQRLLWAEQFKVRQLQKLRCADLRACQTLGKKFAPIKKAPTVVLERAPDIVKDLRERHMMSKFSANTAFPTTCEFLYALKPLGALAFNLFNTPGGPVCYIDLAGTVSHVGAGQALHSELRKIAMERGCKASVLG
eukprot:symbB.v1.2.016719.t2/scaffold1271.1/size203481/9